MKIYLDYAATSPIKEEVKKAMMPFLGSNFGNPSSIHSWGQKARNAVEESRGKVAEFLNANPEEIIFTSGGTESDNLAINGLISRYWEGRKRLRENGKQLGKQKIENSEKSNFQFPISKPISAFRYPFYQPISSPHIITTQIEHHAVLKTCENLEKEDKAEVTYLKPNRDGIVSVEQVKKAIKKNTILVSVMYVNNEIGTIQPIREIGKILEKENSQRLTTNDKRLIHFHTDAVQAAEYLNMNVDFLHVDLLTISAHKIGGPKGVGALYIKKNTPFGKIIFGGEQEMNRRSGTENVAGIVGLGKAIEIVNLKCEMGNVGIRQLRDYFINHILKEIPETELNGSKEIRSPNNANFYFKYIEGESILLNLDLVGIAASSGSACASLSLEPSHVLMAVYDNPERAHGSIRFTLGQETTKNELDYTILHLKKIIKKLRKISPLAPRLRSGQEEE